jgi:O-antigen/teichoic acid export membrane protein
MLNIRLHKFFRDSASMLGSKILVIAVEFLASILIARILGPAGKGVVVTALVIPGIVLSFADLGFRQAITYFMGKKKYNDQQIISTVTLAIMITSVAGCICAAVAYIASGIHIRYGWWVVLIPLGLIPASLTMSYANGILMAKRQITRASVLNVLPDILYVSSMFALLLFQVVAVELVLLANVTANLIAAGYFLREIRKYGNMRPMFIPEILWNLLRKGVIYALALFVISLNYSVDVVILEHLTNSAQVGVYSVGASIANMLWLVPNALHMVNASYSANATDSMDYARKTAFLLRMVLWISLIPFLALFFSAPYLIPWFYGAGFELSGSVVQAILPGVWTMLIFKILNSDLAGRGRPEAALWVFILAAGINVALNLLWDKPYGAIGAAWASTVSYTVGGILMAVVYARISALKFRDLFIPKRNDLQIIAIQFKSMLVSPKRV